MSGNSNILFACAEKTDKTTKGISNGLKFTFYDFVNSCLDDRITKICLTLAMICATFTQAQHMYCRID
jgi:hypothetical protein